MTNRIALLYTARHLALCRNLRRFPQSFQLIKAVEPCLGLPQFNRSTVEEGGSSGTWQLIIRDDENIFYVIWCSHRMCVCVCVWYVSQQSLPAAVGCRCRWLWQAILCNCAHIHNPAISAKPKSCIVHWTFTAAAVEVWTLHRWCNRLPSMGIHAAVTYLICSC